MQKTEKLWPDHRKPQEDELLSSWLVGLARAHGIKPHTFCDIAWPRKNVWNRDVDKSVDEEILKTLAARTGASREQTFQTTLRSYEGAITERHNVNGHSRWILPVGVYHRTRTRFGLQFCPRCLAEDRIPYFRKRWRLAFVTVCSQHGCLLLDRCPACGDAISLHRNGLEAQSLAQCSTCHSDFRSFTPHTDQHTEEQVRFKANLMKAVHTYHFPLSPTEHVYAHLFFTGLHKIVSMLACRRKGPVLRGFFKDKTPYHEERFSHQTQRLDLFWLNTQARFSLLAMADWLLTDWPARFMEFGRETGLTSSDLRMDMRGVPFWYERVVMEHFYRPDHVPTPEEVRSAIIHLRQNNQPVTKTTVSKLLGVRQTFRNRPELLDLLTHPRKNP